MDREILDSRIEESESMDFSRPVYTRQTGELGLYIDILDARPLKTQRTGTQQFFVKDLLEKLFVSISNVALSRAKEHFRRRGLLNGVILEKYLSGIVIALSCESLVDLDALWRDYESGKLPHAVSELYTTPDILHSVGASDIQLRTRVFHDEYQRCRMELCAEKLTPILLTERPHYVEMLRQVQKAQRTLSQTLASLKDEASLFAASSNEFMVTYKRLIPPTTVQTTCLQEFHQYLASTATRLGSARINTQPVDRYAKLLSGILQATMDVDYNVVQLLAQVHSRAESGKQRALKVVIKETLKRLETLLDVNFDISGLIHPAWRTKVIVREEGLFLGLLSLISYCIESIDGISHSLDEYMSGVMVKL